MMTCVSMVVAPALAFGAASQWIESDSLKAIADRTARDFSLSLERGRAEIKALHPGLTDAQIDEFIARGYVEVMDIGGERRMYRKSPRNLALICPEMRRAAGWTCRGSQASLARRSMASHIIANSKGDGTVATPQRVTVRFNIDVPVTDELRGTTLRVWMPYPMATARQSNVKILSASQDDYVVSEPGQSPHSTVYMERKVGSADTVVNFEVRYCYDVAAQYFAPDYIEANLKPYDRDSELYRRYTALSGKQVKELPLVWEIVGAERNPYRQSEMVYDYIVKNFPWAGAREYSTLECIPQYVVDHGYGDCGQVALLYISLMRTLGVPARWESGWMLHPGEKNYHDWAEVYFEGVGWVPVDVSFGRYVHDGDERVVKFHSTGQDAYRMATNGSVGAPFYPAKKFVRSETVDMQAGEVENENGNLFYPLWQSRMTIESMAPIN